MLIDDGRLPKTAPSFVLKSADDVLLDAYTTRASSGGEKETASNNTRDYHPCEPNIQATIGSPPYRILYVMECMTEKIGFIDSRNLLNATTLT